MYRLTQRYSINGVNAGDAVKMKGSELIGDRVQYVSRHSGPHVFPDLLYFSRLIRLAYKEDLIAVKDLTFGYTASYAQLLTDALHFRNVLRRALNPAVVERIDNSEEVFVNLLGPGGYEFTVAFLALMALGAVIVPICMSIDHPQLFLNIDI